MSGSAGLNVVCVLRSGGHYDVDYVEKLLNGVWKHLKLPHQFVCLTDVEGLPCATIALTHDWPGWWAKMELFRPDIYGDILYFDLDTVICGDLTDIASVRQLTMLSDFYQHAPVASGLMYLPWFERGAIWREWMKDPEGNIERLASRGDQAFLQEHFNKKAARWQNLLPGQVLSYKAHVRAATNIRESGDGSIPAGARAICFHGHPRPREMSAGDAVMEYWR